ncbi:MAG: TadE family type IV pilus minor pilin [Mycobacteriales bacterium]
MRAPVPGRPGCPAGASRDGGQVTAEAAVVLPILLVILATALWVLASVAAQVACVDAARVGARAAARGDNPQAVRQAALAVAPREASVEVTSTGDEVTVRVWAEVRPFGPALHRLPATAVTAEATAVVEESLARSAG